MLNLHVYFLSHKPKRDRVCYQPTNGTCMLVILVIVHDDPLTVFVFVYGNIVMDDMLDGVL